MFGRRIVTNEIAMIINCRPSGHPGRAKGHEWIAMHPRTKRGATPPGLLTTGNGVGASMAQS
jgi:hypothetical protein